MDCVGRGWSVLPLRPRAKIPLYDRRLLPHGVHGASTDPELVRRWWTRWPRANVGIATGRRSQVWILDIDGPEGVAALRALVERHGSIPPTFTVRTARGWQAYFTLPGSVRIGCTASAIGDHLDTRGEDGYGIAAGSIHPSGHVYRVAREVPVIEAPTWLVDLVATSSAQTKEREALPLFRATPGQLGRLDNLQRFVLESAPQRVRTAPERARNNTLNREAHGLAACGVPRELAEPALLQAAVEAGLPLKKARATFESGFSKGERAPARERRRRAS